MFAFFKYFMLVVYALYEMLAVSMTPPYKEELIQFLAHILELRTNNFLECKLPIAIMNLLLAEHIFLQISSTFHAKRLNALIDPFHPPPLKGRIDLYIYLFLQS